MKEKGKRRKTREREVQANGRSPIGEYSEEHARSDSEPSVLAHARSGPVGALADLPADVI